MCGHRLRWALVTLVVVFVVLAVALWTRIQADRFPREKFDRIQRGMPVADLTAILGPPGDYTTIPLALAEPRVVGVAYVGDRSKRGELPYRAWLDDSAAIWVGLNDAGGVAYAEYFENVGRRGGILFTLFTRLKKLSRSWLRFVPCGVMSDRDVYYFFACVLILSLYAVKALALRNDRSRALGFVMFLAAIVVSVPLICVVSPLRGDGGLFPEAIYIGEPISTLLIPCLSFLWDWTRPGVKRHPRAWLWRVPLEVLIAVPLWFYAWHFSQLFVLQWKWICSSGADVAAREVTPFGSFEARSRGNR
jgi:hypothetical protein